MNDLTVPEKLAKLRELMTNQSIDALVVMSADPHMSEYLPDYWKTRQWLSGFSGSVGTLVVTQNFAGLWLMGAIGYKPNNNSLELAFNYKN